MKRSLSTLALTLFSLGAAPAFAADAATTAIQAIGQVNGMALACQQPAISSRARNAFATTAPKTRENGEIFEAASSKAYLEQGKGAPCPDAPTFSRLLEAGEQGLQSAFRAPR